MRLVSKGYPSFLLFVTALAVFIGISTGFSTAGESRPEPLVEGNTAFAVRLYGKLASGEGNLFFSPYSISSAMGMTYCGARGNTAKEMKEVLHFPLDAERLAPAFKTLDGALVSAARKDNQKLYIANGLCLTGGDVGKEFKNLLKNDFDAELFSGGLDKINAWVKQRTEGKIEKILESLNANSVCVLLNAIYFKGTWENQFKKSNTHDDFFKVSATNQVTVPLMHQRSGFQILDKPDFQAALIPYKGKHLSMVILLPMEMDGLARVEKQLTSEKLQQWLAELDKAPTQETELTMPKYKLETGYDLIPPCKQLGIKDAFGFDADFSGMGWRKGGLCISQIVHKAFVDVNEEGTEAAAATAIEMKTRAVPSYPVFRADHPFLFIIRDNHTGTILFMGRIVDPKSK